MRDSEVGGRPEIFDLGITVLSDACIHRPTTILGSDVLGQDVGEGFPFAGRKASQKSLIHLAGRVFQPRRRPAELIEPRDRGVEVCLVEYLAAADQVAVDRENRAIPPLGVEALL